MTFEEELAHLINCHSKEVYSGVPDFILADFLCGCLTAFDKATVMRERWLMDIKEKQNDSH